MSSHDPVSRSAGTRLDYAAEVRSSLAREGIDVRSLTSGPDRITVDLGDVHGQRLVLVWGTDGWALDGLDDGPEPIGAGYLTPSTVQVAWEVREELDRLDRRAQISQALATVPTDVLLIR